MKTQARAAATSTKRALFSRITRYARAAFPVLFLAFVAGEQAHAAPQLVANAARIIGDEARTRVVLDFNAEPEFEVHYLDSPARIVVDLPAVSFAFPTTI